jgi:TM2 domain-containing membrane protein YozV
MLHHVTCYIFIVFCLNYNIKIINYYIYCNLFIFVILLIDFFFYEASATNYGQNQSFFHYDSSNFNIFRPSESQGTLNQNVLFI